MLPCRDLKNTTWHGIGSNGGRTRSQGRVKIFGQHAPGQTLKSASARMCIHPGVTLQYIASKR
jgi:hypothetical protein